MNMEMNETGPPTFRDLTDYAGGQGRRKIGERQQKPCAVSFQVGLSNLNICLGGGVAAGSRRETGHHRKRSQSGVLCSPELTVYLEVEDWDPSWPCVAMVLCPTAHKSSSVKTHILGRGQKAACSLENHGKCLGPLAEPDLPRWHPPPPANPTKRSVGRVVRAIPERAQTLWRAPMFSPGQQGPSRGAPPKISF